MTNSAASFIDQIKAEYREVTTMFFPHFVDA